MHARSIDNNSADIPGFAAQNESYTLRSTVKSHCWFCNKPLYSLRHYCGTECREAMYEDNAHAKQRRMIFGCQC